MNQNDNQLKILYATLNKLSPISYDEFEIAKPFFNYKYFDKKEHVIEMEDIVDKLFFITSGMARYYYLTENAKEFNKSFQATGQVLTSISSLVNKTPSPFYIETIMPTQCVSITYDNLKLLCEKYPQWNHLVFSLFEQVLIRKEIREADFLLLNATQRYEKFLKEFSHMLNHIPNYHIASYLGITEVRLSRIRSTLKLT